MYIYINFYEEISNLIFRYSVERRDLPKYDAIIIDEGQDFREKWLKVLRLYLNKNGEFLFASDMVQDVYGTSRNWTDDVMSGCGFSGAWKVLKLCHRLPPKAIPLLNEFKQKNFLCY